MDNDTWMELDDIRTALAGNIGVLLVLADGLGVYTRNEALSGAHAAAYADAFSSAYDALATATRKFGDALERAGASRQR